MIEAPSIEPVAGGDLDRILALNNAHAAELSWLEKPDLNALLGQSFAAWRIGDAQAVLIAFDQNAAYQSPNFLWFRERYRRFVYVDRIVVDPRARGCGHARRLYEALFEHARAAGHDVVTCEVNSDPPNPASDAFHAALGFEPVGEAAIGQGKTVRYFEMRLGR